VDRIKPEYFYICGTPDMVEDAISALKELGIDDSKIVYENS
jgi:ferredoxin-NADP reductase